MIDKRTQRVLGKFRCALCPRPIGLVPFHMVKDPTQSDIIDKLLVDLGSKGTVGQLPENAGRFMLMHVTCLQAASLVVAIDDDLGRLSK